MALDRHDGEGSSTATLVFEGTSMLPTLREPALLVLDPRGQPRVGDVLAFHSACAGRVVVHRVLARRPGGLLTRGDNNSLADPELVPAEAVLGRVLEARLGRRAWTVRNGARGLALHQALRVRRALLRALRPASRLWRLAAPAVARRLAASRQPVVVTYADGRAQALWGRSVVARRKAAGAPWEVREWCRLWVDVERLP